MPDRWLYAQIFHEPGPAGAATDALVRGYVEPAATSLLARGAIDRFFFLRYAEGGNHLRFRVRLVGSVGSVGSVEDSAPSVKATLEAELRGGAHHGAARLAWAVYEPEIAKHGGAEGLEIAETLFFRSSQLACSTIACTPNGVAARALVAAVAMRELFVAAGMSGPELRDRLEAYAAYWHRLACSWVGAHPRMEPSPAAIGALRALLRGPASSLSSLAGDELQRWRAETTRGARALSELAHAGRLEAPLEQVVFNLAHTFHNRLGLAICEETFVALLARQAIFGDDGAAHATA